MILTLPALAQSPPGTRGAAGTAPAWTPHPLRLQRFYRPQDFSLSATLIGFEPLVPGAQIGGPLGMHGVHLALGDLHLPRVWIDRTNRCLSPCSLVALSNHGGQPDRSAFDTQTDDDGVALRMNFDSAINRIGFEMRRTDGDELNVIVHAYSWDPLESTCRHASLSIL